MNVSGTLNALRLLVQPRLCLPHLQFPTFDQIPIPLKHRNFPNIKVAVLDKDNCFAIKHTSEVFPAYRLHFERLKEAYPGSRLLIVSNRAGTDRHLQEADVLEKNTGLKVLRHSTKKPGCGEHVLRYFQKHTDIGVTSPSEIAVIGDRIFTDIMLANLMGSLGVWIRDGVQIQNGALDRLEKKIPQTLETMGIQAPVPT